MCAALCVFVRKSIFCFLSFLLSFYVAYLDYSLIINLPPKNKKTLNNKNIQISAFGSEYLPSEFCV